MSGIFTVPDFIRNFAGRDVDVRFSTLTRQGPAPA